MREVAVVRKKRPNLFVSDSEVKILWNYVKKHCSTKWIVFLGFALFRGFRISEICAINLKDFSDASFLELEVVLSKSWIKDKYPLLSEFNIMLRNYILENRHTFKDGYLFPFHSSKSKSVHMTSVVAGAIFSKWRKEIAKQGHCEFLDGTKHVSHSYTVMEQYLAGNTDLEFLSKLLGKNKKYVRDVIKCCKALGYFNVFGITEKGKDFLSKESYLYRYRISWHSCRRWFETRIWKKTKDKMLLRDIQRYSDSKTVEVYIDSYEVWQKERQIMNDAFSDFWDELNNVKGEKNQLKLETFIS